MNTRTSIIIIVILILIGVIAGALLYNRLPDPVASHWNERGVVDGYMARFWGVWMMPLVATGMFLLFLLIPLIDPLKANIAAFREYFNTFIVLFVAFLLYIHGLTLAWNLGYRFDMGGAMLPALGLFFIYAGVLIGKAKRNWFIGIRTPWTLSSNTVWAETHRIGAKLFMASGILALIGAFFGPYAVWFIMVPLIGSSLFLLVYSYVLYQRENKNT
jgi:uncharacterized membrane protein